MESTLALALDDLAGEVGLFLGWGRGAARGDQTWTTTQQAAITSAVKSGLRQFYYPMPLPPETTSYDWSFLKPVARLGLASGSVTMPLPDDYGGFEGRITILSTAGQQFWPIELVGIGTIYEQATRLPTTTGRPAVCCEEPLKGTTALGGQRFQLRFWPIPDADYTLQFQYYVLPDYLTGAFPYAYGGAAHAETILASCKYAAERDLDDMKNGPQNQNYLERLAASISMDRKMKPQKLGYNRDLSDRMEWEGRPYREYPGITIQGVQF